MKGLRKFIISLVAIVVYGVILAKSPQIDPLGLGLGLGFLITPTAVANVFEHWPGKRKA